MRNFWTGLFALIPIIGVGIFAVAAATNGAWLPENISVVGKEIDHLFYVILGITGFFFVVTELLLVYAMFTSKGRANGKGSYLHGHLKLEIGWTLMTAFILIFIAFYQMPAWAKAKFRSKAPKSEPDALVTGSQFVWQVRYPTWDDAANAPRKLNTKNPNLRESFEVSNELHVVVNTDVLIHLRTLDVIHSFWLINARVKQDALPGNLIPVWFDTNKPGTYEWVCAELCGWGHYRMRGKLVVHEKADFEKWMKEQTRNQLGK